MRMKLLLKGVRILIVDDELELLALEQMRLELYGAITDSAQNGAEGFQKFQENNYDIILTDIRMPNGHGTKLIANIRSQNQRIPILCITAFPDLSHEEILSLGAQVCLFKPICIHTLISSILQHLKPKI